MTTAQTLSGTCLCCKITVQAENKTGLFHACHCDICRRWGGGPMMAFDAENSVTIHGDAHVTIFNSSEWAERGFCKNCGTHLFYRLKEPRHYFLPLGLFAGAENMTFHAQSFIDKKHPGYSFAQQTHDQTAEEFFAQFA